jgi:hypothetical protein
MGGREAFALWQLPKSTTEETSSILIVRIGLRSPWSMFCCAAVILTGTLSAMGVAQALPPPGDGDYDLPATITVDTLTRIAESHRTAGNALGVEFELTEVQHRSLRSFLDRVLSDDSGKLSRHP